ncbi:MAG TPA: ClbS/DfsB family four-helix bundle protein [Ktedonobacterales bacterium]|nr:ClbS/DfsB family four-helix bundle protein [Ktedonobacterales bacterium]
MAETMSKSALLAEIDTARAGWDALIGDVPEARMTEPGAAGTWSVKDVLAHVAVYERWAADQLNAMMRGETEMYVAPDTPPGADTEDTDRQNAAYYAAWRDRSLADVRREARETFALLRAAIEQAPEALLNETDRYAWLGGSAVWQMVAGDAYEHYQDHIPSIRAWLGTSAS